MLNDVMEWGALQSLPEGCTSAYGLHAVHIPHTEDTDENFLPSVYKISKAGSENDFSKLFDWLKTIGLAHTRRVYAEGGVNCDMRTYMPEPKILFDLGMYKCYVLRKNTATLLTWTYHANEQLGFEELKQIVRLESARKILNKR